MDGVLVVDKPLGPTSHDVVAKVRKLIGVRRIGHTGTLDPLATGVLPLVVGRATRLASLLSSTAKTYVADVRFGTATRTYDADARFAASDEPPAEPEGLTRQIVEDALPEFSGVISQVPPAFSAKKIAGVPAYKRARRNEDVTPAPVEVSVHAVTLEHYGAGLARIRLVTSAGFYVRTFAHDLGQRLGCGAHLAGLRRTRAGDFTLQDAVTLEDLERNRESAASYLVPLERLLPDLPGVRLTDRGIKRASHGNTIAPADVAEPVEGWSRGKARLLDSAGSRLLGIAESHGNGLLHPVIVLV
jgi:tRNA pseudouridine55 synthase